MRLRSTAAFIVSTLLLLVTPAFAATGGLLWCRGASGDGRVGDGRVLGVFAPVVADVAESAAGTYHTLIRKPDGSVWACGSNINGQLGDGTTDDKNLPIKIATDVAKIVARGHSSFLLKSDGTLWGFGYNSSGQLGLGTLSDATTPAQIASDVKAFAAGTDHAIFLRNDGSAWGMGDNSSRQLTAGATTSTSSPVQIGTGVSDLAAGDTFTLLLKRDGTVWALGTAAFIPTAAAQPYKIADAIKGVSAGAGHALLLDSSGTLWGIGANSSGQLGDGSTTNRLAPVKIATGVKASAAGDSHSVFLSADGSVWTMGANYSGQLGTSTTQDSKVPVRVATRASSVAAGSNATLYVSDTGVLHQTGTNAHGEGARGTDWMPKSPVLVASNVVKVVTCSYGAHMLFITADGELWATGQNPKGELCDGTTRSRTAPIRVATDVVDAAAGYGFSLFVKRDGTLWAAGDNSYGQLGNGTTTAVSSPVQVAQKVRTVVAGAAFSAYTDSNYFIWATGRRVIPGTATWQGLTVSPKVIGGGATSISAGNQHLVASDGDTVQTMGLNDFGQLGYAPNSGYNVVAGPMNVATGATFAAAGGNRSMYVKTDGTLWGTGEAGFVLPAGTVTGTWQQLDTHVRSASPGVEFALYVKDDNTLWGLGLLGTGGFGTDPESDNGGRPIALGVPVKLASNVDSAVAASGIAYYITLPSTAVAKPAFAAQPQSVDFTVGTLVKLAVTTAGEGPFGYQWRKNGVELPGERSPLLVIPYALGSDAGTYDVVVTNRGGIAMSEPAKVSLKIGTITQTPPASTVAAPGGTVTLEVRLTASTAVSYQWRKDGQPLQGATSGLLTVSNLTAGDAGNYTLAVTNSDGTMELGPYSVALAGSRISNLSVRTDAGTDAQTLIVGFATGGVGASKPGTILVRCIGPTLATFGVSNFLADPSVVVGDSKQTIASNDNWGGGTALSATYDRVGAFRLANESKDAATLIPTATPGGVFTAKVGGGSGNALVELYDASDEKATDVARLTNVSARALLPAGGGPLMAGFVISGTGRKTVLVRAIGPALKTFGLSDALADPKLEILKAGAATPLAANQKWGGQASLVSTFNKVGAFALSADSADAVLLLDLEPGGYTARVTSVTGAGGICLIEVYDVP